MSETNTNQKPTLSLSDMVLLPVELLKTIGVNATYVYQALPHNTWLHMEQVLVDEPRTMLGMSEWHVKRAVTKLSKAGMAEKSINRTAKGTEWSFKLLDVTERSAK